MKLIQKQFLKGSREFEITDGVIQIRLKSPFKEEKLTIMLSMLNPEPVVNQSFLEFHSRVKCGPLLSLIRDKPDSKTFTAFVDQLKIRAREEYNAFAGLRAGSVPEGLAANVYTEPPDFDEPHKNPTSNKRKPVNIESINSAIQMLNQYLDAEEIKPLLCALEALKAKPEIDSNFSLLVKAFDNLGSQQGAVLTYAPYVGILLSDDSAVKSRAGNLEEYDVRPV